MKQVPSSPSSDHFVDQLRSAVLGSSVTLEKRDAAWSLEIANKLVMGVGTLWRLIGTTYVCVTSEDDGHQFGLPSPIDAAAKANGLLAGKAIEGVSFDASTGDLRLYFAGSLILEIVTTSAGYESWQIWRDSELFAAGGSGGLR